MALYFDTTQSANYVILFDGDTAFRSLPIDSMVLNTAEKNGTFQIVNGGQVLYSNQWANIAWTSCVPPLEENSTLTQQMRYLCEIFPTTHKPVVSTAKTVMQTQVVGSLTATARDLFAPLNGAFVNNGRNNANCFLPNCTIQSVFFEVFTSTISTITTVSLQKNGVTVAGISIPPAVTGIYSLASLPVEFISSDKIVLKISTLLGTGTIFFSPITTTLIVI